MEILFIENRSRIFVPYSGGSLRTKLIVKALSEIGHVDIISFAQDEEIPDIPQCDILLSEERSDCINRIGGIQSMICVTLLPENPYSYYQLDKNKEAIIDMFVKKKNYDIIACHFVESAIKCGLLKYRDRLVIDADDNLETVLKFEAEKSSSLWGKWKNLYKANRIRLMINKLLDSILCSFCSNRSEYSLQNTVFLPNTSSLNNNMSCPPVSNRLLFVGNLTYWPNKHGINYFVNNIFPIIKCSIPKIELRIVGKCQPDFLTYLNSIDRVEAVGRVEDLEIEYQKAAVVVIPIYYGSGTCVKFVESQLMNRAVVSSPVGARGFSEICQDRVHYMLANNDEEFASKTVELLSSASKSKEIADNGYRIANQEFSKSRFMEIVKESISNCKV